MHIADCYGGKLVLRNVESDPHNPNMVYGRIVRDLRPGAPLRFGAKVWIAAKQVSRIP